MVIAEPVAAPALSVEPRATAPKRAVRLDYLDALKVGLTVLVIAHHAGQPYGPTGGRWPVFEAERAGILGPFFSVNAAFFMGLFFLISAYFLPTSFNRKGAGDFLRDRAVRLGIPLLAVGLLIGRLEGQWFDPAHMWFVAHLLVYGLLYTLWRTLRLPGLRLPAPTHRVILGYAVLLAGVTAVVRTSGFPTDRWVTLLGVLPIEVAHLPQYASLFLIGILAARGGWLTALPSRTGMTWLMIGLGLAAARYVWTPNAALWSVWESFLCVGLCVGLLVLFRDHGQAIANGLRRLAPNAYGAYVLHVVPVVVGLQFALTSVDLDPFIKFTLVTVLGVPLSFGLAAVLRRLPGVRSVL